jgi:hypothetical protein
MSTEDRLVTLIRAGIEEDLRGVALPADLVQRVVARPPRRRPRWRLQLAVVVVAAAVGGAVALTSAVLPEQADRPRQPVAVGTPSPAPFDPTRLLTFGTPPDGWAKLDTPQNPGGLREVTDRTDQAAQVRRWLLAYVPPGPGRRKGGRDFLRIEVATGRVTIASARAAVTVNGPEKMTVLPVPVGTAEYDAHAGDGGGVRVIWQPRPGMVIVIQSNALPKDQLFAVVRGIRMASP